MIRSVRCFHHIQMVSCAAVIAIASTTQPANSCAFHYYVPQKTVVDWLTDGSDVILARPSETNQFAFETAKVLRGVGPSQQLPYSLDASMRKKMKLNPNEYVLFSREAKGNWKYVSYVNAAYLSVVEQVVSDSGDWQTGYGPKRFTMFVEMLDHADPELQKLALREIDKAPYELLRSIEVSIPTEELLEKIWDIQDYEFQSIRILLLGLSNDDKAREVAHGYILRTKKWGDAKNLGAFVTALLELDDVHSVEWLESNLLSDKGQSEAKLEQVIEAIAIHNGIGSANMRAAIHDTLRRLIEFRPEVATMIARQFGQRKDWSQRETLAQLLNIQRMSRPRDLLVIAAYVSSAHRIKE